MVFAAAAGGFFLLFAGRWHRERGDRYSQHHAEDRGQERRCDRRVDRRWPHIRLVYWRAVWNY